MAGFTKADRQRIIDEYLATSGANMFQPAEFIDWLSGQPDHEAYEWFFGMDDAQAAREHRILMARQMANGLRIVANVSRTPDRGSVVAVTVREFPAMVSPMAGRRDGGGYVSFDPDDPALVAELRRQGAQALRGWLARYRGVAEIGGLDVSAIEEIARSLDGVGVVSAA
jgi:hypothetical protein